MWIRKKGQKGLISSNECRGLQEASPVEEDEVRIIQGVANEAVLDGEPVAELGCRECGVAYLTAELRFQGLNGAFQFPFFEGLASDDDVHGPAWVSQEGAREDDGGKSSRPFERIHDVSVLHRIYFVHEERDGARVFEFFVKYPRMLFLFAVYCLLRLVGKRYCYLPL